MTTVIDAANVAVVQGQLSGPPRRRELPSGQRARRARRDDPRRRRDEFGAGVVVRTGALADSLQPGDAVLVVGYVRRRFFRAAAVTQSRTEVVAQRVVAAGRRAQVARALDEVAAAIIGEG